MVNVTLQFENPYTKKDGKIVPASVAIVSVYGTKAFVNRVSVDALAMILKHLEQTDEGKKWQSMYLVSKLSQ